MTSAVAGTPGASIAGLDDEDAARRLAANGPNVLPTAPAPALAQLVGRQPAEPLTLVLVVVAALTLSALRQVPEGFAIAAIVLLNVSIGVPRGTALPSCRGFPGWAHRPYRPGTQERPLDQRPSRRGGSWRPGRAGGRRQGPGRRGAG